MTAKLIAATLLLTTTGLACAGDFYVAGSIGRASYDDDKSTVDAAVAASLPSGNRLTSSSIDDKKNTFKLQLGYQFTPNWGVEGGYMNLGETTYAAQTANFWGKNPEMRVTAKLSAWNLAGVGTLPINDQFSVFGKIGAFRGKGDGKLNIGSHTVNISDTDTTRAMYGIGLLYNLNPVIGLRAEYEHLKDYGNMVSGGVQAKF